MSRFLKALHSGRVLLMDGAMGTELQRAGLTSSERGEVWNLTHPERVRAIHQAYVDAGAECLLTNTFQANPAALAAVGREADFAAILHAGVALTRAAAGTERFVLLDVGPFGGSDPVASADTLVGAAAGADGILLETCSTGLDLAQIIAARIRNGIPEADLPTLISWTYLVDGTSVRTATGSAPSRCVAQGLADVRVTAHAAFNPAWLSGAPVDAVGVNCGRDLGMKDVALVVREYRSVTNAPLFARPNAGTPVREGDHWLYPVTPSDMARNLPALLETGIAMVGGCCGTTPKHIAAMRPIIDDWNA